MFLHDAGAFLGGGLFSPLDISGLKLWLDAADATTITESGGLVSNWADKSGNGIAMTASGTSRPTTGTRTINSKNALDFDGTTDILSSTSTLNDIATNSAVTGFFVLQVDAYTASAKAIFASGTNLRLNEINTGGGRFSFVNDDGGSDTVNSSSATTATTYALMLRHEGGNIYISRDGGAESSAASGDTATMTSTIQISESNAFDGILGEVLFYNRALTANEIATVTAYLKSKWGIA